MVGIKQNGQFVADDEGENVAPKFVAQPCYPFTDEASARHYAARHSIGDGFEVLMGPAPGSTPDIGPHAGQPSTPNRPPASGTTPDIGPHAGHQTALGRSPASGTTPDATSGPGPGPGPYSPRGR